MLVDPIAAPFDKLRDLRLQDDVGLDCFATLAMT